MLYLFRVFAYPAPSDKGGAEHAAHARTFGINTNSYEYLEARWLSKVLSQRLFDSSIPFHVDSINFANRNWFREQFSACPQTVRVAVSPPPLQKFKCMPDSHKMGGVTLLTYGEFMRTNPDDVMPSAIIYTNSFANTHCVVHDSDWGILSSYFNYLVGGNDISAPRQTRRLCVILGQQEPQKVLDGYESSAPASPHIIIDPESGTVTLPEECAPPPHMIQLPATRAPPPPDTITSEVDISMHGT